MRLLRACLSVSTKCLERFLEARLETDKTAFAPPSTSPLLGTRISSIVQISWHVPVEEDTLGAIFAITMHEHGARKRPTSSYLCCSQVTVLRAASAEPIKRGQNSPATTARTKVWQTPLECGLYWRTASWEKSASTLDGAAEGGGRAILCGFSSSEFSH